MKVSEKNKVMNEWGERENRREARDNTRGNLPALLRNSLREFPPGLQEIASTRRAEHEGWRAAKPRATATAKRTRPPKGRADNARRENERRRAVQTRSFQSEPERFLPSVARPG